MMVGKDFFLANSLPGVPGPEDGGMGKPAAKTGDFS
jgi:hypothetical protein